RLKGNQGKSFKLYQEYEESLTCEIKQISLVSEKLLASVDINFVQSRRKRNFQVLHEILGNENLFFIPSTNEDDIPFAYPFLPAVLFDKSKLYGVNIFVPNLWADPIKRNITNSFERNFAQNLMPLPVDE